MIEYDFNSAEELEEDWGEDKRVFKCENCGAESIFDKDKTAQFCPFCGSSYIVQNDDEIGIKPTLLVPFKTNKNNSEEKFKVWISAFDYKGKVYRFMVNGQTGEVDGEAPVSALKVILLVLSIITIIAIIFFVVQSNGNI